MKSEKLLLAPGLFDLFQGMTFLHMSPLVSHGSLKSSKCLVDSRWTLKVSGFGMSAFTPDGTNLEEDKYTFYRGLQWTAPELLRMPSETRHRYGTPKGDVYSFGIILHEIVFRCMPFDGVLPPEGVMPPSKLNKK